MWVKERDIFRPLPYKVVCPQTWDDNHARRKQADGITYRLPSQGNKQNKVHAAKVIFYYYFSTRRRLKEKVFFVCCWAAALSCTVAGAKIDFWIPFLIFWFFNGEKALKLCRSSTSFQLVIQFFFFSFFFSFFVGERSSALIDPTERVMDY